MYSKSGEGHLLLGGKPWKKDVEKNHVGNGPWGGMKIGKKFAWAVILPLGHGSAKKKKTPKPRKKKGLIPSKSMTKLGKKRS